MNGTGQRPEIDELRNKADILTVVGDYVQLKKKGRYYVGLCPFHSEKTPSFTVTPERGIFHCFGCGEGGDVFTFVQHIENMGFIEAARLLAERFQVPWNDSRETGDSGLREDILRLNGAAQTFFERVLASRAGQQARDYLASRKITPETAALYHVGYAPSGSMLVRLMRQKGVAPERLEKAGLALWGQNGFYDRFRDRLMFPIHDHRGRVVGFGGRVMGDGTPKYLNSSESPVFSKGQLVYGLDLAHESIRRQTRVFVVEGYMDVLALRQHGLPNVVATLGTALTAEHGRLISRYAREVFLAYDADTAGQAATIKGLEVLRQSGLDVRIIELPSGEDPDTFAHRFGIDAFLQLADGGPGVVEYQLERLLNRPGLDRPESIAAVVQETLPVLAGVSDAVERDVHVQRLAARLGVSQEAIHDDLREHLARLRKKTQAMDTNRQSSHTKAGSNKRDDLVYVPLSPAGYPESAVVAEQELVKAMSLHPELAREVYQQVGDFSIEIHSAFLRFAAGQADSGAGMSFVSWVSSLEPNQSKYIRELVMRADEEESSGSYRFDVKGSIERVRRGQLIQKREQLDQKLRDLESRGVLGPGELKEIQAERRLLEEQLKGTISPLS